MKTKTLLMVIIPLTLCLSSCSVNEAPDFVTMKNVKVQKLSLEQIIIGANAMYYNPNSVGCDLVKTELDVFADDIKVGHILQTNDAEINAKSNFMIPIRIAFPARKILKDKKKLLRGVAAVFGNREVEVRYDGSVTVDIVGVQYETPFEYKEVIPLKRRE